MGHYHVLSVSEDALKRHYERRIELEGAVGSAVVSLCVGTPVFRKSEGEPHLVMTRDILNSSDAIQSAGDVHNSETTLFVWSGVQLKRLRSLTSEELMKVAALVSNAMREAKDYSSGPSASDETKDE